MEDVLDVGLGGEAAHGGCVVCGAEGLSGGDAEVWIALGEAGSGGEVRAFGIAGDDGVAIDDDIMVGDDGARECLVGVEYSAREGRRRGRGIESRLPV